LHTDEGGYLVGASSYSDISGEKTQHNRGGSDWWLIKLDKNGNKVWDKTIGGDADDNNFQSAILRTEDGGYILGSYSYSDVSGEKTEPSRGGRDYWLVKLDKNFRIEWDKTIGGSDDDYLLGPRSIQEIRKNVYAAAGTSWSSVSGDKTIPSRGEADFWQVVLDASHPLGIVAKPTSVIPLAVNRNNQSFSVNPIPAKDKVYVRFSGKVSVVLTDKSGKQVLTQTVENNDIINVANIPAGTYFLKNSSGNQTEKIMILKLSGGVVLSF
jgi:hypothetical protein